MQNCTYCTFKPNDCFHFDEYHTNACQNVIFLENINYIMIWLFPCSHGEQMVTKIKWLFVLGLLFGLMDFALTSHFRGGHISWEPVPNEPNKVNTLYRTYYKY